MSPDRLSVTIAGVLLIAFIVWFFWFKRSKGTRAAETSGGYQEAMILVKGGYTPDTIIVNFGGRRLLGVGDLRRAMEAALASPLAEVTTTAEIDDVRFVRPDVAIVSCTKHVSDRRNTTETFASMGRLTYVVVEHDGAWRIALAQTTPVAGS